MNSFLCGVVARANVVFRGANGRRVLFSRGVFTALDGKRVPIWTNHKTPVGFGVLQASEDSLRFRMRLDESVEHRQLRADLLAGVWAGASASFRAMAVDGWDSEGVFDRVTGGLVIDECGPVNLPCCTGTAVWIEQVAAVSAALPSSKRVQAIRLPAPPKTMLAVQDALGGAAGVQIAGRWFSSADVRAMMNSRGPWAIW
ncbi:MAG: hypothetical protein ACK56E_21690 [Planctomyces sp.]|jgi:hypothetical protein